MAVSTYPSGGNFYVPSFEASGKLQIEFSRNPKDFSINRYTRSIPVTHDKGHYLDINTENAARILNTNLADFKWARGATAPTGDWNKLSGEFKPFYTDRLAYPFQLDNDAVKMSAWDVVASHGRMAAQLGMTARTQAVVTALTTTGNWGSNTNTAATVNGSSGALSTSTTTTLLITKTFNKVSIAINKATRGVVKQKDIVAVISPVMAELLAESPEMVQRFIQSQFALQAAKGELEDADDNSRYGLPRKVAGVEIVIEDAVKVTNDIGGTLAQDYILSGDQIIFCSRPGGLMGSEGVPDFATVQQFVLEDMTTETMNDQINRRTAGRVVDDFDVRVAAPLSGYLVTSIT